MQVHLFQDSLKSILFLFRDMWHVNPEASCTERIKRRVFMIFFVPLFSMLQLTHWLGFLLDALLYPDSFEIRIRRPLFILGPPRSGTTHLHRVLSRDQEQFTTPNTWELFLAPSIIEKKLILLAIKIDRLWGHPIDRLISTVERKFLHNADIMHPSALQAPEEDYFFMCMTLTCSGLILLFPQNERLWRFAFFNSAVSEQTQNRILSFYKLCLQKHLYMAGAHKTLLSKNASFNPWIEGLNRTFPDANFIICARNPVKTVPSMLSVADAARRSLGGAAKDPVFQQNMITLMKHHYHSLLKTLPHIPRHRYRVLPIKHLHTRLRASVLDIYRQFGLSLDSEFTGRLNQLDRESRSYQSTHKYTADRFGLNAQQLETEFAFAFTLLTQFKTSPQSDRDINMSLEQSSHTRPVSTASGPATASQRSLSDPGGCRIAVLSDAIPDRNGVGTYYRDLLSYLRELSHKVEMIPAKANCYFRQTGISLRMPGDYTQRIHFPNIIRIARRMRELKPDVIVAPTLGPFGVFAYIVSRRHGIRLIVGHHTAYDKLTQMYWKGWRAVITRNCLQSLSRFLMRSADAVVATADEMAHEAKHIGARQVHCVGTTISKDFFQEEIRPFSGHVKTVLFAGRLASEKNIWALMDAAEVCPDQTFLIAGEGPERPALQEKAKILPNVKLLGWLSRKQLLRQIDSADMLILPSHIESFGTIALEGMARGRLVLVSRHCGILQWPELAEGLYSIGQDETLAGALERIAADEPSVRQEKAETAYQLTRAVNNQTLTHWQTIISGHGFAQN